MPESGYSAHTMSETGCQSLPSISPSAPSVWVMREFEPWRDAEPRARLLLAGPGFGKTQSARAIAEAHARDKASAIAWLSLRPQDASHVALADGMQAALIASDPPAPAQDALLGACDALRTATADVWQRFWMVLGTLPTRLVLVLDDLHTIQETLGEHFWSSLVWIPDTVRLVLTARERPDAPLARMQANNQLRVITGASLRFRDEEIRELIQHVAPGRMGDRTWWRTVGHLDGWPLGVTYLAITPDEPAATTTVGPTLPAALASYIEEECLSVLSHQEREALPALALLEECQSNAWQAVVPTQRGDWLRRLGNLGLLDTDTVPWVLFSHLKHHLLLAGKRLIPANTRLALHATLADHYLAAEQIQLALPHLAAARRYDELAQFCEQCFPLMYTAGREAQMTEWLRQLPRELVQARPALAYWAAMVPGRREHRAPDVWDEARAICQRMGDRDTERWVLLASLREALWPPTDTGLSACLSDFKNLADGATIPQQAQWQLIQAQLAVRQHGDWETLRLVSEEILTMTSGSDPRLAFTQVEAAFELTRYWLMRGDWAMATQCANHGAETARTWNFPKLTVMGRFICAEVLMHAGRDDEAAALVRHLPVDWSQSLAWQHVADSYRVLGWITASDTPDKTGEALLLRSLGIYTRHGEADGMKLTLSHLLTNLHKRGQSARAEQIIINWPTQTKEGYHDARLIQARALNLMAMRHHQQALALITPIKEELQRLKARWALFEHQLIEAVLHQQLGQREAVLSLIRQAHAIAENMGYQGFLKTPPGWLAPIVPLLSDSSAALVTVPDAPQGLPVSILGTQGLSVRMFGGFEVRRNGDLITEWPRRKAQLVLAGLILYQRGLMLLELTERLGRDEVGGNVTTTKVAVSALRRVLEPEAPDGGNNWRVITREGERYKLEPTELTHCDVLEFENHLNQGDRLWQSSPQQAAHHVEQAVNLYTGHLLDQPTHERYFIEEREAFRQRAHGAFLRLAQFYSERNDHREAERILEQAAQLWPADEDVAGALMVLFHRQGLHDRLRMTYWDCRKALKSILNRTPGDEFETLYRRLQAP